MFDLHLNKTNFIDKWLTDSVLIVGSVMHVELILYENLCSHLKAGGQMRE